MNNIRSLSLPLFLFSLITTPSPSHIHFSLPVLKINYSQGEFCIEAVWSHSFLVGSPWYFLWFSLQLIVYCLWAVTMFLFPFMLSCFAQYKPLAYPRTFFSPPTHWQQLNNLYGLDCMSLIYCWAKIYFISLKSCHVWLFKISFDNQSHMHGWAIQIKG